MTVAEDGEPMTLKMRLRTCCQSEPGKSGRRPRISAKMQPACEQGGEVVVVVVL
jgi:hypothetical protein